MPASKPALIALLLAAGLLAGCGKNPGLAPDPIEEERAVQHLSWKGKANQPKAVVVDGKTYREGQAPAAFTLPQPAAPEAGKGHLRAAVSIKDLTDATAAVSFHVMAGDEAVFAQLWEKADLKAAAVACVAENLEPGEYDVLLNKYNKAMGLYHQKKLKATVKADQTVDLKL